ncbi:accessory gene regulator AgrB [Paraclostridium ghonii]|uniref:accessory gene regulator AgrB n=1 Tax=Paraclostridium ghonii TaxID=29358 RepID=UPI003A5C026E
MATNLANSYELDRIQFLKCKLGIELLLINFTKFIVVYGLAFILHTLVLTAIFHLSFFCIRVSSYGVHAKNSWVCSVISLIVFVLGPKLAYSLTIPAYISVIIALLSIYNIYKYAPGSTKKNKINISSKQTNLKIRSLLTCIIILIISFLFKNNINNYFNLILLGQFTAVLGIMPIAYKISERECFYENNN